MYPSLSKKQYVVIALVVVVLVIANIAGFWFFFRPQLPPNTFGGKVLSVSDQTLSIVDARGEIRSFIMTSSTAVVLGRKAAPETTLTEGTFVLVTAESSVVSATATKIRLMSTDSFTRKAKPVTP